MLDDNRFVRNVKSNEEQLRRIMVRRMKRDVPPKWDGTPAFSVRKTESLDVDHSPAEREAYRLLTEYAASRREAAKKQSGDAGVAAADFVIMLFKKRLFSSPKAFAETIERHLATMTARSESGDAVMARADAKTSLRVLRPLVLERLEETPEDDTAFIERQEEALTAARRLLGPLLTQHEQDLLQCLGA